MVTSTISPNPKTGIPAGINAKPTLTLLSSIYIQNIALISSKPNTKIRVECLSELQNSFESEKSTTHKYFVII